MWLPALTEVLLLLLLTSSLWLAFSRPVSHKLDLELTLGRGTRNTSPNLDLKLGPPSTPSSPQDTAHAGTSYELPLSSLRDVDTDPSKGLHLGDRHAQKQQLTSTRQSGLLGPTPSAFKLKQISFPTKTAVGSFKTTPASPHVSLGEGTSGAKSVHQTMSLFPLAHAINRVPISQYQALRPSSSNAAASLLQAADSRPVQPSGSITVPPDRMAMPATLPQIWLNGYEAREGTKAPNLADRLCKAFRSRNDRLCSSLRHMIKQRYGPLGGGELDHTLQRVLDQGVEHNIYFRRSGDWKEYARFHPEVFKRKYSIHMHGYVWSCIINSLDPKPSMGTALHSGGVPR